MELNKKNDVVANEEGGKVEKQKRTTSWKPFLRQLVMSSVLWMTYFNTGMSLGAPTVVIPQLRKQANCSAAVSDEMASWLSSALSYSCLPWIVILPILSDYIGRKLPFLISCCASSISFVIFYLGTNSLHFLISQIIQGILLGSNLTVSLIVITECTSPSYRGIFLTTSSASLFWGMWASNAIGVFLPWNYIGLLGLVCSVWYLNILFFPESPYYLAKKGRYDECVEAYHWWKGEKETCEVELEKLMNSQKEERQYCELNKSNRFKEFYEVMKEKRYHEPILISFAVLAQYHASGKMVYTIYSIELLKHMTKSEDTATMGMLILNGISVIGMYFGCVLSRYLNRRTLLLCSSYIGILILFIMAVYFYSMSTFVGAESRIVSLILLSIFYLAISCGPMIISGWIFIELVPLKFKCVSLMLIIFVHFALLGTTIKLSPLIFKTLNLEGAFFFFGTLSLFCTCLIQKYLPETKDMTLQEIEKLFYYDQSDGWD